MSRIFLIAIAMLAFVAAPPLALSGGNDFQHHRKAWYVDIEGDGTCYVRYKERPKQGIPPKYVSADAAYRALVRIPACGITAGQLQHFRFLQ